MRKITKLNWRGLGRYLTSIFALGGILATLAMGQGFLLRYVTYHSIIEILFLVGLFVAMDTALAHYLINNTGFVKV